MGAQFQVRSRIYSSYSSSSSSTPCSCRSCWPRRAIVHIRIPRTLNLPRGIQIQSRCRKLTALFCCKFSPPHDDDHLSDSRDYLLASLLIPETVAHYRLRRKGFKEEAVRWNLPPTVNKPPNSGPLGHGFLGRFHSPTIFLKVSCDGDFLLPIIVGDFAIEKLMDALWGDNNGDFPDQYQLVGNVVLKLGYKVQMVRITQRVINTYFARLYFSKTGESEVLSVDVRPSDAINIANRCKAPIFVSKNIVLMDAIRISYGMGRVRDTKPTYDVSLDSAVEGSDALAEELHMVKNMIMAVKEERYHDAALWRDRLMELRKSTDLQ